MVTSNRSRSICLECGGAAECAPAAKHANSAPAATFRTVPDIGSLSSRASVGAPGEVWIPQQSLTSGARASPFRIALQILMDKGDSHAALPHCGGNTFDRTQAHIATCEYTGHGRLEQVWIAVVRPTAALERIVTGEDIAARIPSDGRRYPFSIRVGADEDEQPPAIVAVHRIAPPVVNVDRCQVSIAVHRMYLRAQQDCYVGLTLQLIDQILRHALMQ